MCYSLLFISILSFGMAHINLIDYKAINHAILSNNPRYGYGLELPSMEADRDFYLARNPYAFIVMATDDSGNTVLLYKTKEWYQYKQLNDWQELHQIVEENLPDPIDRHYLSIGLFIDKDMPMSEVNKLRTTLLKADVSKVYYIFDRIGSTQNRDEGLPRLIPQYYGFDTLDKYLSANSGIIEEYDILKLYKPNKTLIQRGSANTVYVNEQPVPKEELKHKIQNCIRPGGDYVIVLDIDDNMIYEEYVWISKILNEAIYELTEELALEKYGVSYDSLSWERAKELRATYPLAVFEMTDKVYQWLTDIHSEHDRTHIE